jgi:putative transposase
MTSYRRARIAGASYFFTVALADRHARTLVDHIETLRAAFRETMAERPFRCEAIVVLPEHLHAIWTLPAGDADFSTRWRLIKARFTRATGLVGRRSASQRAKDECGVWQRRFWERCLRDEADFEDHVRYCWANPVRHRYVERASEWPYSSIHRDIREGRVEAEWSGMGPVGEFGERSA